MTGKEWGLTKDGMERGCRGGRMVVVRALGKPMRAVHALCLGSGVWKELTHEMSIVGGSTASRGMDCIVRVMPVRDGSLRSCRNLMQARRSAAADTCIRRFSRERWRPVLLWTGMCQVSTTPTNVTAALCPYHQRAILAGPCKVVILAVALRLSVPGPLPESKLFQMRRRSSRRRFDGGSNGV
jgi:hypothetical protein